MKLVLDLPTDVSLALRRLAHRQEQEPADAAIVVLRDALIGLGEMELADQLDEASDTRGEA